MYPNMLIAMICFVLASYSYAEDLRPADPNASHSKEMHADQPKQKEQQDNSELILSDCEDMNPEETIGDGAGEIGFYLVFGTALFSLCLAVFGVMHDEKYISKPSSKYNLLGINSKGYLIVLFSLLLVVVGFSFQLKEMLDQRNELTESKRKSEELECKLSSLKNKYDRDSIRQNLNDFIKAKNEQSSVFPNLDGQIEYISLVGWTPRFPEGHHKSNFLVNDFHQMIEYLNKCNDSKHVKKLVLNTDHLASISGIRSLTNLDHLQLNVMKNIKDKDLSDLSHLHNLKVLHFYETNLTGECLSFIPEDNKIENLVFSNSKFEVGSLKHLKKLKHLKELNLYHNNLKIDDSNFDLLSDAIKNLKGLNPLKITTGNGTDIGRDYLQKIKDLRTNGDESD